MAVQAIPMQSVPTPGMAALEILKFQIDAESCKFLTPPEEVPQPLAARGLQLSDWYIHNPRAHSRFPTEQRLLQVPVSRGDNLLDLLLRLRCLSRLFHRRPVRVPREEDEDVMIPEMNARLTPLGMRVEYKTPDNFAEFLMFYG